MPRSIGNAVREELHIERPIVGVLFFMLPRHGFHLKGVER